MRAGVRRAVSDACFVSVLLLIAAVPLLWLRGLPSSYADSTFAIVWGAGALVTVAWLFVTRNFPAPSVAESPTDAPRESLFSRGRRWVVAALFVLVMWLAFYEPMKLHFWGGVDEFAAINDPYTKVWSDGWDRAGNRPMLGWVMIPPHYITPERIEGFLWFAATLCLANGFLLWGIASQVLPPAARPVSVAAGILLLVNRADPSRFLVLWTTLFYWGALFVFLTGVLLYLWSYRTGRRVPLVIACILAGSSLLMSEGLYPLAAFIVVLLWTQRKDRAGFVTWAFAWSGTVGILAIRFVCYLAASGTGSYQAKQSAALRSNPLLVITNLLKLHKPIGRYFDVPYSAVRYFPLWCVVAAAAALAVWLAMPRSVDTERRRPRLFRAALFAAVAVIAAVLPFLHLGGDFRTQFFSAPCQAVEIACVIAALTGLLGQRVGTAGLALVTAVLAGNSAVNSRATQKAEGSVVRFEKVTNVFQQIHALSPNFAPNTVLVFLLDDPKESPIAGFNYPVYHFSRILLGCPAGQMNFEDRVDETMRFTPDGVDLHRKDENVFPFDQVLAFRLHADGTLEMLEELPPQLRPADYKGHPYAPLARLRTGPFTPVPFLRDPSWVTPVDDVLDVRAGLTLTEGWSSLICDSANRYRMARPDAGIVLNSLGNDSREIDLDVATPDGAGSCELQARNKAGNVVATVPVTGRARVHLTLPTSPESPGLFHLRLVTNDSSARPLALRVFASRGSADSRRQHDIAITNRGVRIADDWYPLEFEGERPFRWLGQEAGLTVNRTPADPEDWPAVVEVDLEPGPGVTSSAHIQLVNGTGQVLFTAKIPAKRGRVLLTLPLHFESDLHLRIEGGGNRAPRQRDVRTLNVRVFRIQLAIPSNDATHTLTGINKPVPATASAASVDASRQSTP